MPVTIKKNNAGTFLVDGVPYQRGAADIKVDAATSKVGISVNRLNNVEVLFNLTHFSQINNGETDTPFASFNDLITYLTTHVFQVGDTSTIGSFSVVLQPGENFIGVAGGVTTLVAASFIRPANTTAYNPNQVVGTMAPATVLQFTDIARKNGGTGYITKAKLISNKADMTTAFRLHLYSSAPGAIADGQSNTIFYANRANYIGFIDFGLPATSSAFSDCCIATAEDIRIGYAANAGSRHLHGVLECLAGWVPNSAQQFYIELTAENN